MKLRRISICMFLVLVVQQALFAISFRASAPESVVEGEPFRLVYSLDEQGGRDIRIADMSDFDIVAGPFTSSSTNMQIINGSISSSSSETYTYTLIAKKKGTYTIPSATIEYKKQKYNSNSVRITVLPADESAQRNSSVGGGQMGRSSKNAGGSQSLSSKNVFVRAIPSKTKLYEQDNLLITYKLYSKLDVVRMNARKIPDFNGFFKQEIELPNNAQIKIENYNGVNYGTVVLYQAVLYPQHAGDFTIDEFSFDFMFRIKNQSQVRSFFADFFDTYQDVEKNVVAPKVTIKVDPLPNKSSVSNFSGGVGTFSFQSGISSQKVSVDSPISLKYTISGTGNLKLIKTPKVEFPSDFESYDPKVENQVKTTTNGITGSKTIEYLLIPRSAGDFEIPAYEFVYFDLASKSYKTIKTQNYKIHVEPGTATDKSNMVMVADQEQLKVLGSDIQYIDVSELKMHDSKYLISSVLYWFIIIVIILCFVVLFFLLKKIIASNSDVLYVKNKKANKLAIKRLRVAEKCLREQKNEQFYDEVFKAMWGYLSDKLSIPISELTKDTAEEKLLKKQVKKETIETYMGILSTCEFARYAPSSDVGKQEELYNRAISLITTLQQTIK